MWPADGGRDAVTYEVEPRVLVAVVNNRRDLDIARSRGWYRIPLNRAPTRLAADFLAFYQTGAFGDEGHAIRCYGQVRGYRLVTRVELLPDEPDHPRSGDRYYRLDLGPLQNLPKPIRSERFRRVTFIPTTLSRLLSANEIGDLWEEKLSAEKLWAALRERGIPSELSVTIHEAGGSYRADVLVPCRVGVVAVLIEAAPPVESHGWTALHFSEARVMDELPSCVDEVCRAVSQQGGLHPLAPRQHDNGGAIDA